MQRPRQHREAVASVGGTVTGIRAGQPWNRGSILGKGGGGHSLHARKMADARSLPLAPPSAAEVTK